MNVPETLSTEIIPIQASTFALSVLRDATAVFVNRINSLDCESAFGYMKVGTALYEITAAIADAEVLLSRAQIRNEQNLIIMPAALPAYSLVRFQEDNEGRIHRVWVLREDESAVPLKLPGKIQRQ